MGRVALLWVNHKVRRITNVSSSAKLIPESNRLGNDVLSSSTPSWPSGKPSLLHIISYQTPPLTVSSNHYSTSLLHPKLQLARIHPLQPRIGSLAHSFPHRGRCRRVSCGRLTRPDLPHRHEPCRCVSHGDTRPSFHNRY